MPTLDELRDALRSVAEESVPPPGLVPGVRRRMRRSRQTRAGAVVLAVATAAAGILLLPSGDGPEVLTPPPVNAASPTPTQTAGMTLVQRLTFDTTASWVTADFTATGPDVMVVAECEKLIVLDSPDGDREPEDANNCGWKALHDATAGLSYTYSFIALPYSFRIPEGLGDALRDYLKSHGPTRRDWTIRIYSGVCTAETCNEQVGAPPPETEPLPTDGLPKLFTRKGTADARTRPLPLPATGTTRLKLVCREGAGWAIVWRGKTPSDPIDCERAESGSVWDEPPGSVPPRLTVYPASVSNPAWTGDLHPAAAELTKLAKNVKPLGSWTLTAYQAP